MIGSILRATRGFEVTHETLSLETIREVCIGGPGHFLGHRQPLGPAPRAHRATSRGHIAAPEGTRDHITTLAAERGA